jgi:hypothetical protein
MARFVLLAAIGSAAVAFGDAVKIGDLAQGSAFSQCVKITDFNTKSLGDDVAVTDKVDGCCPEGYIPGIKWYKNYWGAMIVCGFKDDGSVNMASSTSNGAKTCEYNTCYVVKMDITCADSSKMTLDGCCPKDQWTTDCKMYSKSQTFFSEKVGYCLSYAKKYKLEGTNELTDDQVDSKLALTTIKAYTGCAPFGSALGGSSGASPSPTTGASPSPSPTTGSTYGYELVGDAACVDASGSHGSFTKSTDKGETTCRNKCSANSWCTGYDNRAAGCIYYKITIAKSNGASTAYKCYRKVTGTASATGCNDFDGSTPCNSFQASSSVQASLGVLGLIGALVGMMM